MKTVDFSETVAASYLIVSRSSHLIEYMKVCHMTKMAARPMYGKNPSKLFFSGTGRPIFTKLGMWHRGLQPIIVCSNDDPGLTLTYFTARSNFVIQAFP